MEHKCTFCRLCTGIIDFDSVIRHNIASTAGLIILTALWKNCQRGHYYTKETYKLKIAVVHFVEAFMTIHYTTPYCGSR
jgi:hypothetical protein